MILAQHRGVTLFARQNIWTEKYRNASPPILESCLCHWLVIYTLQASYFTRISRLFYLVITAFECILTVSAEMKPEVSVSIWKVTFASPLIRRQSEAIQDILQISYLENARKFFLSDANLCIEQTSAAEQRFPPRSSAHSQQSVAKNRIVCIKHSISASRTAQEQTVA